MEKEFLKQYVDDQLKRQIGAIERVHKKVICEISMCTTNSTTSWYSRL
jgi:hypothetical protein